MLPPIKITCDPATGRLTGTLTQTQEQIAAQKAIIARRKKKGN